MSLSMAAKMSSEHSQQAVRACCIFRANDRVFSQGRSLCRGLPSAVALLGGSSSVGYCGR